jgi:hypothetical protein
MRECAAEGRHDRGGDLFRKTCAITVVAISGTLSLCGAPTASAATQVGNACVGDRAETGFVTLLQLANAGGPPSISVPQAGVITKWGASVIPYPGGISEKLKVFRPAAGPLNFTAVGESTTQPIVGGVNSFDTRVPVQAGDRLGVSGTPGAIYCEAASAPTDVMGVLASDPPLGSIATFTEQPNAQASITATVEPDVDGDGYGDETQDKCPQSAATQAPCPVVTLSAVGAVKKALATVSVTSSSQASVTVAGKVKLGKGKTAKLSGGTQIVAPGTLAKFVLLFPKKLQSALKALPRKSSLTLSVTVSAPNVIGAPTTKTLKLHLKGQAKAKKHSTKKARS